MGALFVPVVGELRVKDWVLWSQSAVVFTTKPEFTPTHYTIKEKNFNKVYTQFVVTKVCALGTLHLRF